MPGEIKHVTGVIADTRRWTSGKGSFINLEGDQNDYYKYGACTFQKGDKVELRVKQGAGQFSEKFEVVGFEHIKAETPKPAEKVKVVPSNSELKVQTAEKIYTDRNEAIVKQSCLKASAPIVAALISTGVIKAKQEAKEFATELADFMYCYVVEGEEPEAEAGGE